MTDLPKPLTPASGDLRNFPFTPLFRSRLFGSSFHARSTDSEWRAGVTLWLKSWDQMPAGSLPDDEVDLCRLAELGRDLKSWRKVKDGAMRGWILCADGRWYHPVVAEGINEALEGKAEQRTRTLKARIAALVKKLGQAADDDARASITRQIERLSQELSLTPNFPVTDSVTTPVTESNRNRKGNGEGKGIKEESKASASTSLGAAKTNGAAPSRPPEPPPSTPEPDIDIPPGLERRPAILIIRAFDESRAQAFGPSRARPWPGPKDLGIAQRWVASGADVDLCRHVFDSQNAKLRDRGRQPMDHLAGFDRDVTEAIEARKTAPPGRQRLDNGMC